MTPAFWDRVERWLESRNERKVRRRLGWVPAAVKGEVQALDQASREDIRRRSAMLFKRITARPGDTGRALVEALALASRAVKHTLGFYPNDTQLMAALELARGKVIELRSGEGKTIVALLAAYWLVLRGRHVDIATTNDYLALRDQRWVGLIYTMLGASVGVIISTTPRRDRRGEYDKHVTYVANQELGFDYLRDNLETEAGGQVRPQFDFVIIDEADSVLIDEARTSLIIAEPRKESVETPVARNLSALAGIVRELLPNQDYEVDYRKHSVAFTDQGIRKITARLGERFFSAENISNQRALWHALYAEVFLKSGKDYIVHGDKVILVDEFTGHALPDRVLLEGLQQAVEVKDDLKPSGELPIIADITYRNFFKLHQNIAGMTGTAWDARGEFSNLYDLEVAVLEPHHGLLRRDLPTLFFRTEEEKLVKVVSEAKAAREHGYPLLLVGRHIAAAKKVSEVLSSYSLPHQLLHAEVGQVEAQIIEAAGKPGVVTVATNMAGRGADIVLEESLRYRSGLRVIGLEHNLSRRVDEQLRGRAGRQGQFGRTQFFASLEDALFQIYADDEFWDYCQSLAWPFSGREDQKLEVGVLRAQRASETIEAGTRLALARFDSVIDRERHAIYVLRQAILLAPVPREIIIREIRRILSREHHSAMPRAELEKFLEEKTQDPRTARTLASFFFAQASPPTPALLATKASHPEEEKKAILRLLDQEWQEYLEQIRWVQDWIGLTAIAGQDPYAEFTETTDRMFHDMRRELALKTLSILIGSP